MAAKDVVLLLLGVAIVITLIAIGYWYWYTRMRPSSSSSHRGGQPEVFLYYDPSNLYSNGSDATTFAQSQGWTVASAAQLTDAYQAGAQWCAMGYATDQRTYFPMQCTATGCGSEGTNKSATKNGSNAGVLVYGVKPAEGTANVQPFSSGACGQTSKWSQYD